jgi:predicted nucleic acid-binding protein
LGRPIPLGRDALTAVIGSARLRDVLGNEELHAPALLDFEVVSALRGLTRTQRISAARALDVLTDFEDLPVHRWAAGHALRRRAFDLRENLTAYDAANVALAEALECQLVTRDARLARATGHAAQISVY